MLLFTSSLRLGCGVNILAGVYHLLTKNLRNRYPGLPPWTLGRPSPSGPSTGPCAYEFQEVKNAGRAKRYRPSFQLGEATVALRRHRPDRLESSQQDVPRLVHSWIRVGCYFSGASSEV